MNSLSYPPVDPTVAETLTENWRVYYAGITKTPAADAFRGFKIPLSDLEKLVDIAKKDNQIDAVRAYLAIGRPLQNGEIPDAEDLHILLVPVAANGGTGTDVLEVAEEVDHKTVMVSAIYDFTTPCPAQCDFSSPLYSKQTTEV